MQNGSSRKPSLFDSEGRIGSFFFQTLKSFLFFNILFYQQNCSYMINVFYFHAKPFSLCKYTKQKRPKNARYIANILRCIFPLTLIYSVMNRCQATPLPFDAYKRTKYQNNFSQGESITTSPPPSPHLSHEP